MRHTTGTNHSFIISLGARNAAADAGEISYACKFGQTKERRRRESGTNRIMHLIEKRGERESASKFQ